MKIDRPTNTCSGWLADFVELVNAVVASGNSGHMHSDHSSWRQQQLRLAWWAAVCAWLVPPSIAEMNSAISSVKNSNS